MKKLCLILTVLYAIWANCSAQSLNIARNLLEGNSSTFDSGWGSWDEQGNCCGRSLKPIGGPDGSQCARLTPKQASNDWDAQLKYNFAATQGTTYVFRLKAKKVSGDGKIKAIMQHNTGSYEQIAFFEKNVTGSWATYEGEVTADRTDYNVIVINYGKCGEVLIDDIEFGVKTDNVARTINVDGKTREYWLYVPASVKGQENVPVVFSLHGRGGTDDPNDDNSSKYGKPTFTSLADKEGFIVVYPQGRDGTNKADYPDDGNWNDGFVGTTGWEATGKENADTKFIKALVDKIQDDYKTRNNSNSNISVNPKKFYLCGFSMGGMMTYACAKVLNGTFAAYGSCSGYPLNEFHMNLATENPIPFIHLHGNKDNMLGIKHLNTIIENLLFRNGCDLSKQVINTGWSTTKENGEELNFKKYDFIGVEGVPVTTVTFDGLGHNIEASAPAYLWNFFKDKTTDMYKSDIEWKWDMPTINANITHSSSPSYYGWKHEVNSKNWSLTYGGGGKTECSIHNCSSADPNCTGNHNVYNSIQLTPGKHTLYAKMTSTSGESSVTLRNILTGAETVARKVIDNSGTHDHTNFNVLYEFEVGEGAEFSLELKFSDSNSACNLLEIHKGSYRPQGVKDESQDNASINLTDGKLAELTFENGNNAVDIYPLTSGYGTDLTSVDGNMKLYLKSRLGIKNGEIDNKAKYIVKDAVFGH
ncbi:dienelactone hydrolase family protein [Segatella hominis]